MGECERCEMLERLLGDAEEAGAELGRQVAGLQRLLTRAGQTEVALRAELARQREDEPEANDIKAVCAHWKRVLEHPNAKIPLSGERAKKVRARLRDKFTVEQLKLAVDGCARVPYVGPHGRKETGTPKQRHDDLTLICRDEETVERFIRYAEEAPRSGGETPGDGFVGGPTGVPAILGRLEGVRQTKPGQWEAKCPAHDDRHASLSVGQGDKGAVVHCHAGCDPDAVIRAAGVEIGALFDSEPVTVRRSVAPVLDVDVDALCERLRANPRVVGRLHTLRGWSPETLERLRVGFDGERLTFPVLDGSGQVVNVLRYLPGDRANGERKLLAAKGCPRDLFPAPETIQGDECWLVEGEPDAISGHELGLPAVAVPGVNGWRVEWAQRLSRFRVTICMDCDEPGRAAARRIHAVLPGSRVLDLEPERTDGYDLSDALLEHVDAGFLRVMADAIVEMAA